MQVLPDLESVSRAGADLFVKLGVDAIEAKGRFDVALSGGSTPKRMYELLASPEFCARLDWGRVHLFWSDERYIPRSDPQSNEGMARSAMIESLPIPADNVHGMFVDGGVSEAADRYAALLIAQLGDPPVMDLTLLGLGPDGHTASLFPYEPAVHVTDRNVVAGLGHAGVAERITMTPPMINRSRTVAFLVAGADKAAPLKQVLEGPEDWNLLPSQAIARHAPNVVWLVDAAAAAAL